VIGFWIAALLMVAVALVLVVPPLAGRHAARGPSRREARLAVYHDRVRELEAQRGAGTLDVAAFEEARAELDRELLRELEPETGPAPDASRVHPYRAVALAVLIPAAAVGIYLATGNPALLLEPAPAPAPAQATRGNAAPAQAAAVEEMVAGLERRLEADPSDAEGWLMLGRSYLVMERPQDASRVLARALEHHPRDAALLVTRAEALATLNGNRLDGEPMQLVSRALAIAPDMPRALWLAGIHDLVSGDPASAVQRWERVLASGELDEAARLRIEQAIAQAREAAGGAAPAPAAGSPASVRVQVSLAPQLGTAIDGSETLYVFARAAGGPPMPLAVKRLPVSALPAALTLDDADAMTPELGLSRFDSVVVTARVSRSGAPAAQPGDLEGVSDAVSPHDAPRVEVVIDRVLE